jgi:hypothetical protein
MEPNNRIHHHSAPEEKIALFRSLFRGREDVYPRKAYAKSRKSSAQSVRIAGFCRLLIT